MPFVIARSSCDEAIQPALRGSGLLRFARNDGKAGFRVEFARDWKQAKARWGDLGNATPFQNWQWLEAWYGAFANIDSVEPLIAIISDAATGEQAVLLPLIRRTQNGIRIVEPADLDLTDYNAPLLGPAAPRDAKAARAMWKDLRGALRRLARRRRSDSPAQDAGRNWTAAPIRWRCSMARGRAR